METRKFESIYSKLQKKK